MSLACIVRQQTDHVGPALSLHQMIACSAKPEVFITTNSFAPISSMTGSACLETILSAVEPQLGAESEKEAHLLKPVVKCEDIK